MYADTSVILSLYVTDVFTTKAESFCQEHVQTLTVSAWVDLEVRSALSFLVRKAGLLWRARRQHWGLTTPTVGVGSTGAFC